MPEGDTIFRTAARLRPVLTGRAIEAACTRDPAFPSSSLLGRTFARVEARGKHLLMHLDDQRTIHSHLGMHGSWHLYQPGEPWRKDRRQAALVLDVPNCVCIFLREISPCPLGHESAELLAGRAARCTPG